MADQIDRSADDWKKILSPEQFEVLREHGTERAFTGKFYQHKEKGMYLCAGCGAELFSSDTKYESGSGWPSFFQPAVTGNVETTTDKSYGMVRTEVHCAKCGGHLGHVFPDGPPQTGLRYCINSLSLGFEKRD